jgi:hypothetical protein
MSVGPLLGAAPPGGNSPNIDAILAQIAASQASNDPRLASPAGVAALKQRGQQLAVNVNAKGKAAPLDGGLIPGQGGPGTPAGPTASAPGGPAVMPAQNVPLPPVDPRAMQGGADPATMGPAPSGMPPASQQSSLPSQLAAQQAPPVDPNAPGTGSSILNAMGLGGYRDNIGAFGAGAAAATSNNPFVAFGQGFGGATGNRQQLDFARQDRAMRQSQIDAENAYRNRSLDLSEENAKATRDMTASERDFQNKMAANNDAREQALMPAKQAYYGARTDHQEALANRPTGAAGVFSTDKDFKDYRIATDSADRAATDLQKSNDFMMLEPEEQKAKLRETYSKRGLGFGEGTPEDPFIPASKGDSWAKASILGKSAGKPLVVQGPDGKRFWYYPPGTSAPSSGSSAPDAGPPPQ